MLGILVALLCAFSLVMGICGSNTAELSKAAIGSCSDAVQLALYLAGSMALWGGLMKIAQEAGITKAFERVLSPVTRRLFAGCSDEAMKSISVNITANLLGLGNAATPAGIAAVKAIAAQGGRNVRRNIAMLVVLNTASIQLIPTTVGALRAKFGAQSPFDITLPTLAVSLISAVCGCAVVWVMSAKGGKYADR